MASPLSSPVHPRRAARAVAAVLALATGALFACDAPAPSASPATEELVEPDPDIAARDLFCGAGGCDEPPRAGDTFRLRERHERGSSSNLVVEDARGRVWNAKLGSEVHAEIAASRLLWAVDFHQPPMHYVRSWKVSDGPDPGP